MPASYEKIRGINWSSLKRLAVSPLEYKYRIDHPEPPRPAFLLGSAIHCAVLEPDRFDERYALCEVRRNKRDTAYKEWLAEHGDMEALNTKEMAHVKGAAEAVLSHRVADQVLSGCRHEEPLVWDDPDNGFRCKGRVDAISPAHVVDLKTDRDPSPQKFARHAAEMMYHGQLSLYQTGAITLKKIDGKTPPYIIAVAKEPPYDVAVYQMKPEDLAAGRTLCLSLMRKLEECVVADMWPGCAPDLQYLDLPRWAAGLQSDEEEVW
jgi:hypothetical protein